MTTTNGHIVPLPNVPTRAQVIAITVFKMAGGDIVRLQPITLLHLASTGMVVSPKVESRFQDAMQLYAPESYYREMQRLTADDQDALNCDIAAEVYRLVHR